MDIYHYDRISGEYKGKGKADPDPVEKHSWLVPAYATTITPPAAISGFARCFIGGAWRQMEDHRGMAIYNKADGAAAIITDIGPIPEGYTDLTPTVECPVWTDGSWVVDPARRKTHARALRRLNLRTSDQQMARITEDLIDTLIRRGIITLQDLPAAARDKLVARQTDRTALTEE